MYIIESIGAAEITLLPPLAIAHAVVRSTDTMEIAEGPHSQEWEIYMISMNMLNGQRLT